MVSKRSSSDEECPVTRLLARGAHGSEPPSPPLSVSLFLPRVPTDRPLYVTLVVSMDPNSFFFPQPEEQGRRSLGSVPPTPCLVSTPALFGSVASSE